MSTSVALQALARLEQAGARDAQATMPLQAAAQYVADRVALQLRHHCPALSSEAVVLPRGYQLCKLHDEPQLRLPPNRDAGYDRGDPLNRSDSWTVGSYGPSRAAALQFSADIATGLLDDLAQWVEARTPESLAATALLEAAISALASAETS